MNIDTTSFGIGLAVPIVVGAVAYVIGHRLRHKCKTTSCGCATVTHYRLLHLHDVPLTKSGFVLYAVYKFRSCHRGHVSVSMKTKMFSTDQISIKPKEEFDWTSGFIERLCSAAGIKNPGTDYMVEQFNNPTPTPRIPIIGKKPFPHR